MLTLTHPSSKDLLWVGDKGRAWSDLDVQEHFLEVIYDPGKIDNTEVIYDQDVRDLDTAYMGVA